MSVAWNPTERTINCNCMGAKMVLGPNQKGRIKAVVLGEGNVLSEKFIAQKYLDDNRKVGLVVLTDDMAEKITDIEAQELAEESRQRLLRFCQEQVAEFNALNQELAANSRALLRPPDDVKKLALLAMQIEGVDNPDEIGVGFLSAHTLRKLKQEPTLQMHLDAIGTAVREGSAEAGQKVLGKGPRAKEIFPGAPSEAEVDDSRRRPAGASKSRAKRGGGGE